jgi:hypothetical protein
MKGALNVPFFVFLEKLMSLLVIKESFFISFFLTKRIKSQGDECYVAAVCNAFTARIVAASLRQSA